jgi:archaeal cell division control protein 6
MQTKTFAEFVNHDTIYMNKEVLKKGYNPETLDRVIHRDETIDQYMYYLKDAMTGNVPDNILVTGKVGVGKTMITTLLTKNLVESANLVNIDVHVIYTYCENFAASANLLRYINSKMPIAPGKFFRRVGMSVATNFDYFCELVKDYDGIVIIVLDEIDQLEDPDIINRFARIKESNFASKNVCLIGITNKTKFTTRLETKTKSVISQYEMVIPPYDAVQLGDILKMRAEIALKPGVLTEGALRLCAAKAAQQNGDARRAIDLLRVASEIADKSGKKIIEDSDVRLAEYKLQEDTMRAVINTLPMQSKIALHATAVEGIRHGCDAVTIGEIYATYTKICSFTGHDPLTQRRVMDLLTELEYMDIITSIEVKSKGRYGRSSHIQLGDKDRCVLVKEWLIPFIAEIQ